MATLEFIVPQSWDGKSLSAFLRGEHRLSGTTIKNARRAQGGLTMDGCHIRTIDPVRSGAVICVRTDQTQRSYTHSTEQVPILYEDSDLIVFNKPAGMPCHPSKGHPYNTLTNVFAALPSTQGAVFRAIGRLDKDTTGTVLCAKHAHAAWLLGGEQMVRKCYVALLARPLPNLEDCVNAPIVRESADSQRRCVRADGQNALTHYRVLLSAHDLTLVALWLETGRTHQIRVHMAHIGCPLVGDALYDGDCTEINRHALHCYGMSLVNPLQKVQIDVRAALPEDMRCLLEKRFSARQLAQALEIMDVFFREGFYV